MSNKELVQGLQLEPNALEHLNVSEALKRVIRIATGTEPSNDQIERLLAAGAVAFFRR